MAYERACALDEVTPDQGLAVTLGDLEIVVALSEGEVADCQIECWLHGSMFDLRTGKPTNLPATEPVATFPVELRDGAVYVDVDTTLNGVTPA
jgi:3-phenylpropionate/trans-cinnamate dioxygenase ferredoxin subunit